MQLKCWTYAWNRVDTLFFKKWQNQNWRLSTIPHPAAEGFNQNCGETLPPQWCCPLLSRTSQGSSRDHRRGTQEVVLGVCLNPSRNTKRECVQGYQTKGHHKRGVLSLRLHEHAGGGGQGCVWAPKFRQECGQAHVSECMGLCLHIHTCVNFWRGPTALPHLHSCVWAGGSSGSSGW